MNADLFAGMTETDFVRAYAATTLRKPQIVSDNVLTGIPLADESYRIALAALLLQEAVEAARRLMGVWTALTDRTRPVARSLAGPLPRGKEWRSFAADVATADPAQLLRAMAIDSSARQSAEELVAFSEFAQFETPLLVFDAGPPVALLLPENPAVLVVANVDADGRRVEARWSLERDQVTALADATGYFVLWAGDFLGAYIDRRARPSANP